MTTDEKRAMGHNNNNNNNNNNRRGKEKIGIIISSDAM